MEYIKAKTIITRTKNSSWFGCEYNMNIYKGCCHGCIYCDSRSDCYRVEHFDNVRAKENALELIRDDLRRKVKTGVICTGAMSDPYNPFEKELCLTRNSLELINAYEFGIAIATKSSLITRDIDVLCDIKKHSPVIVKMTITTANDDLCRKIEPNVTMSSERFEALLKISQSGLYGGVLLMPILPFINDDEKNILSIVHRTSDVGGRFIYGAFGLTQRQGQREYFQNKLEDIFGIEMKEKYMKRFGSRYTCSSPNAKKLYYIFANECEKLGLLYKMHDIRVSYKNGYGNSQLSFL